MTKWNPIETAPKDGRELVLLCGHMKVLGNYHSGNFGRHATKAFKESSRIRDKHGNVVKTSNFISNDGKWLFPTHWIELPPAPINE